jgi:hypothetical protein
MFFISFQQIGESVKSPEFHCVRLSDRCMRRQPAPSIHRPEHQMVLGPRKSDIGRHDAARRFD